MALPAVCSLVLAIRTAWNGCSRGSLRASGRTRRELEQHQFTRLVVVGRTGAIRFFETSESWARCWEGGILAIRTG